MEKYLIIQTAFIGDAILTLPMIQKLKELNPHSLIDVIAIPQTAIIFSHSAAVNRVHILDKRGEHKSPYQIYKFAKFIKKSNYTRIYSPHRSLRTSLRVIFSGVRETYGFNLNTFKHTYKFIAEYEKSRHEVERNLQLIKFAVANDNWRILPRIEIPEETEALVKKFFVDYSNKNNFAAVAPGSIWNTKIYPQEYMEEVIRFLAEKFDCVFIIGGEGDKKMAEELESRNPDNVRSVAGTFNLIESISFLKRMKFLISNDSAPSHLGMCADIPVLMIYCSTVPDFGFYPYNKKSYFLSYNDLSCKPCGIHGYMKCPLNNFACGYNLKPDIVKIKIKEMINV